MFKRNIDDLCFWVIPDKISDVAVIKISSNTLSGTDYESESPVFNIKGGDFDLCVIGKYPNKYLRKYSDFIALEKYPKKYKGEEFETQVVNWNYIKQSLGQYLDFHAWHFSNAYVIYDKNKKFKKFKKKYNKIPQKQLKKDIFRLYESAFDNLNNAKKAKKRKFKQTKLFHLMESFNNLFGILYLINNKPIPSTKWKIYLLKDLKIKGDIFPLNIKKANNLLNLIKKPILKKSILTLKDFKIIEG